MYVNIFTEMELMSFYWRKTWACQLYIFPFERHLVHFEFFDYLNITMIPLNDFMISSLRTGRNLMDSHSCLQEWVWNF